MWSWFNIKCTLQWWLNIETKGCDCSWTFTAICLWVWLNADAEWTHFADNKAEWTLSDRIMEDFDFWLTFDRPDYNGTLDQQFYVD